MYFVYVEHEGNTLVLFDKFGEDETSHFMETVRLLQSRVKIMCSSLVT